MQQKLLFQKKITTTINTMKIIATLLSIYQCYDGTTTTVRNLEYFPFTLIQVYKSEAKNDLK